MNNVSAKDMGRIGVIDVGSNSVRLVVFDGTTRSPAYFYNEKVLCGLGIGLSKTGVLNPEGRKRALMALRRFQSIAQNMDLAWLGAVATEAVRSAQDGTDFCQEVLDKTGIELLPITGKQEAELSAKGVLLGWRSTSGLVCDIGGASMELAQLESGKVVKARSSKLGPMSVMGLYDDPAAQVHYMREELRHFLDGFGHNPDTLFLVGGSWRAIAKIHMKRCNYPLHVVHDYTVSKEDLLGTLHFIEAASEEVMREYLDVSSRRLSLLPVSAKILDAMLERLGPSEIAFSTYGLREGLLFENMSASVRKMDPIIEAVKMAEMASARFPGFGAMLFEWMSPLLERMSAENKRLINAACHLHDVHWRSHPDYRSELCFEAATHVNLGGIDHRGRAFLAWCLAHRYKANTQTPGFEVVELLLTQEEIKLAEMAGSAIRLGAMMSAADPEHMGRLVKDGPLLSLVFNNSSREWVGEVVIKRFEQLVATIGCQSEIVFE